MCFFVLLLLLCCHSSKCSGGLLLEKLEGLYSSGFEPDHMIFCLQNTLSSSMISLSGPKPARLKSFTSQRQNSHFWFKQSAYVSLSIVNSCPWKTCIHICYFQIVLKLSVDVTNEWFLELSSVVTICSFPSLWPFIPFDLLILPTPV